MQPNEKIRTLRSDQNQSTDQSRPDPEVLLDETRKDMGKVALFVSLLTVILMVIFFFGINQNINGLSQEVEELTVLQEDVTVLNEKVADLENLPVKTRNMFLSNILEEMSQKTAYVGGQMNDAQAAKLEEARALLQEVKQDLGE